MTWQQDDSGWFFRALTDDEKKSPKQPHQLGMDKDAGFVSSEHVFVRTLELGHTYDYLAELRRSTANDR